MSEPATDITVMSYQGLHFRDEMAEEIKPKVHKCIISPLLFSCLWEIVQSQTPGKRAPWSSVGGCSAHGVNGNVVPGTTTPK